MDTTRPTMPETTLVEHLVQDPSERLDGPDGYGFQFSGTGGGELDTDSGVLELSFCPFEGPETGDDPQEYGPTVVRFVEVEKLLTALSMLGQPGLPMAYDREWWREVLTEKLDAGAL